MKSSSCLIPGREYRSSGSVLPRAAATTAFTASDSARVSPPEGGTHLFGKGTAVTRRLRSSASRRRTDRMQNPQVPSNTRVSCGGRSATAISLIVHRQTRRSLTSSRPSGPVEHSNLLLTHPAREELLPGPVAHGLLESQVSAGADCAGRLAWQRERPDEAVSVTSPQVAAEKLFHLVHAWPGDVGHEAGRLAEGELDEPGRHFTTVDRLEPDAG